MSVYASLIITCLALNVHSFQNLQIVGGSDAPDGAYPYQVSLRNNGKHFCGGAIIDNLHIITAAHCVKFISTVRLSVTVGSNYLDKSNVIYKAETIIVHVDYNRPRRIHDIALIRVTTYIKFNENIQPIALPPFDRNYDNHTLVATGWGKLKVRGGRPNRLQKIILLGYSQKKCNNTYFGRIKKSHICTFTKVGEGMCRGDSGGPLVADGVLVGLVSYGYPCGIGYPDVYTRVFYYRQWINDYTRFW